MLDPNKATMITDHMEMAKRIGLKYAKDNSKYPPECVAEAYCLVTDFFVEHDTLYRKAVEDDSLGRVLGTFIKRSLGDYFKIWRSPTQQAIVEDSGSMPDTDMLDYLTGLFNSDADGLIVFRMMKEGLGYDDITSLAPHLRQTLWKMRTEHAKEIRRRYQSTDTSRDCEEVGEDTNTIDSDCGNA